MFKKFALPLFVFSFVFAALFVFAPRVTAQRVPVQINSIFSDSNLVVIEDGDFGNRLASNKAGGVDSYCPCQEVQSTDEKPSIEQIFSENGVMVYEDADFGARLILNEEGGVEAYCPCADGWCKQTEADVVVVTTKASQPDNPGTSTTPTGSNTPVASTTPNTPVATTPVPTIPVVSKTPIPTTAVPTTAVPTTVVPTTPAPTDPAPTGTPEPTPTPDEKEHCDQGVGNGPEGCSPGNSDHNQPPNDEGQPTCGYPGNPCRKGGK